LQARRKSNDMAPFSKPDFRRWGATSQVLFDEFEKGSKSVVVAITRILVRISPESREATGLDRISD
jgi:hypothetical protein